jgi:serine/threonine protein kinase
MGSMEIARFQILRVLGAGAQGVVVLVQDHEDAAQQPVVLKVLQRPAGADTDSLRQLQDEARILAWLSHPNIVKVHRLLEKDGLPIMVMEHVEGTSTMEQLVRAREGLPAAVAVEVASRAARALHGAWHARGPDGHPMRIVHRDVKPANLLVSLSGQVKVVDFGVALGPFEGGDPTTFIGTPGYIAPERRGQGPETPAVDVYALGVTLFELLTGKLLVAPRMDRSLERLCPRGVPRDGLEALRGLLAEMCHARPERRPELPQLVERLSALSEYLGPADMRAYAFAHVAPLLRERGQVPRERHPSWPDVAFLEEPGVVRDLRVETSGPTRRLALRTAPPPPALEPMLAQLERRPWWCFWKAAADPGSLVEALVALRGARDARVVRRAYELTNHPDPRVTEAAWELLAAAC